MNKNLIVTVVAVLLIGVLFSGCFDGDDESSEESRFIGTWIKTESIETWDHRLEILTFFSDGTVSVQGQTQNWEVKEGTLVIEQIVYNYQFSNNYNALNLTIDLFEGYAFFIKE